MDGRTCTVGVRPHHDRAEAGGVRCEAAGVGRRPVNGAVGRVDAVQQQRARGGSVEDSHLQAAVDVLHVRPRELVVLRKLQHTASTCMFNHIHLTTTGAWDGNGAVLAGNQVCTWDLRSHRIKDRGPYKTWLVMH